MSRLKWHSCCSILFTYIWISFIVYLFLKYQFLICYRATITRFVVHPGQWKFEFSAAAFRYLLSIYVAFRKLLSIYVFSYFPFGFEGRMWDLIVSVPDHCLSFYFPCQHCITVCLSFRPTSAARLRRSEIHGLKV